MEAQAFLVVEATPNPDNADDMQKYGSQSYAIMAKHGGEPAANYKVQSVMDLGEKPAMIGVFSFPSAEAINGMVNDPEYLAIVPFRNRAFSNIRLFVCGG
ncbi:MULTISPECIES: DUF1330 domain-containing protein [Falsihalocynthiibacter]|uniref:DUF1330 domain-containing protein n=1 Tax=Falsihalocynthiibacter TaxID=2854182 RepID=UPI003001A1DA